MARTLRVVFRPRAVGAFTALAYVQNVNDAANSVRLELVANGMLRGARYCR